MASIVLRTSNPVPRTRVVKLATSAGATLVKSARADWSRASTVSRTTVRGSGTGPATVTSIGTAWYCKMSVPSDIALKSLATETIAVPNPEPPMTRGVCESRSLADLMVRYAPAQGARTTPYEASKFWPVSRDWYATSDLVVVPHSSVTSEDGRTNSPTAPAYCDCIPMASVTRPSGVLSTVCWGGAFGFGSERSQAALVRAAAQSATQVRRSERVMSASL